MRLPVCGARAARRLWSTAGVSGPRALHMTCRRGTEATTTPADQLRTEYDAVIVGAGHNGLVCAAYLQAQGLQTCVLERRHLVGGAAVTEEVVPGYKFSRASYLLSLLRPQIAADLELKRHGLKVHLRNPSSYTPLRPEFRPASGATSLTLSADHRFNQQQIGRFSERDAQRFGAYEAQLSRFVAALDPLLDAPPPDFTSWEGSSLRQRLAKLRQLRPVLKAGRALGSDLLSFYELMTAPSGKILNQWFESEPLKATLATDSLIGAMMGPNTPGSGYNLLHHVAGEIEGVKGAWAYPEGGMGAVSAAICSSALERGAHVFVNQPVSQITTARGAVTGVALADGREVRSRRVLSNATPQVTFQRLMEPADVPAEYRAAVENIDYTSPVCKINVAVDRLPNFLADPNVSDSEPMPHHRCTIHLNSETTECLESAYRDAAAGRPSKRPMIEMVIPSSLDATLAPPGHHVCLLFTQYCPYSPAAGPWDQGSREAYAGAVFDIIEEYAPGFKASVVGKEVLTPPDIEETFGLTGGNIFHGVLSLDQLWLSRPSPRRPGPRTAVAGLYLCGSGSHPGGGVMGAPGRLAALAAAADRR
ncbi:pyridine nucleotide-disulfide oxidoreductase domain-containing protein 2-like [Amphibalanus amphitrite]|uniref:pyridine nucleotide-disulfide oxidoreductase domain-containing protein 2-like n=1 Tax=Amphibalanus amphitrite TaxID=1232801 RepID=UPI001C9040D3|nr:pyridine nucleotide-disulfide oxidoreductase domain-containing protein 2-like [Amphibalanus amphitrite]